MCPSCRRLLRIPLAGEATAPLMLEQERPAAAETPPTNQTPPDDGHDHDHHHGDGELRKRRVRKRRTAASGQDAGPSWEHGNRGAHRSGRSEQSRMRWMLAGGAALFLLIVGGIVLALRNGGDDDTLSSAVTPLPPPTTKTDPPPNPDEAGIPRLMKRSEAELLAEAEPLARKFLEARSIEEMLKVVRNPAEAGPRLQRMYPDGRITPPGLAEFNPGSAVAYADNTASVTVRTADYAVRQLDFVATPAGLRIDWESWAGWSDLPWSEFIAKRPTEPQVCRVVMRKVDYYNNPFEDDARWRSYRLESQDGDELIYGYVERGSVLDERLQLDADAKQARVILKLRFPEGGAGTNQVRIEELVNNGWVMPERESP